MSNLFKSGFTGIQTIKNEPYILDVNARMSELEMKGKIIRPVEEISEEAVSDEEEDKASNQALLDDAMIKSKDILDEARERAKKILDEAKAEAKVIRENAEQEGYNKGLEDGNMEAMKRADKYLENIQREQNELMEKNNQLMEQNIADTENKIIDVMCELIDKLTGILVNDYKPVILHMINNALNESETSRTFVIRVSEQHYPYVSDNKERLTGAANPNISIEIFGDPKLQPQQCIIESENGIIDLSMDVQVRKLVTAIKLLSE